MLLSLSVAAYLLTVRLANSIDQAKTSEISMLFSLYSLSVTLYSLSVTVNCRQREYEENLLHGRLSLVKKHVQASS